MRYLRSRRLTPFIAALVIGWSGASHGAATSTGYRVERHFLGSVGGSTFSTGYRLASASVPTAPEAADSDAYRTVAWLLQPSLASFLLTVQLTGSGSVNSYPPGIACTGGVCSASFPGGTVVTLMQTPGSGSLFGGWSGACSNVTGDCYVTLDAAKTVEAAYATVDLVRLVGSATTSYGTLQGAYDAAAGGNVLLGRDAVLPAGLLADRAKSVTVRGGYDTAFRSRAGYTVLDGALKIRSGRVVVDRVKVR